MNRHECVTIQQSVHVEIDSVTSRLASVSHIPKLLAHKLTLRLASASASVS